MKTFTLLPNPFTEAPTLLLEDMFCSMERHNTQNPAVLWYIPSTKFNGKAVKLYANNDFIQLVTRDCDLDLGFLDLKASVGGWFLFECDPLHALEHYTVYETHVLGHPTPHKTFGCKHFDIYENANGSERFYVPRFEGTYETQIICATPIKEE